MAREMGVGLKTHEPKSRALNIVFVAAIVLLAVAAFAATRLFATTSARAIAQVHDADGNVYDLPLSTDTRMRVESSLGYNVVVVKDGAVYVEEADCPNHDCIEQGAIASTDKQIICLPHELWIGIVVQDSAAEGEDVYDTTTR